METEQEKTMRLLRREHSAAWMLENVLPQLAKDLDKEKELYRQMQYERINQAKKHGSSLKAVIDFEISKLHDEFCDAWLAKFGWSLDEILAEMEHIKKSEISAKV